MNVAIKITNYLVVLTTEIFRGCDSLHVDFNFMFVNS